jgi:hypothetical protein
MHTRKWSGLTCQNFIRSFAHLQCPVPSDDCTQISAADTQCKGEKNATIWNLRFKLAPLRKRQEVGLCSSVNSNRVRVKDLRNDARARTHAHTHTHTSHLRTPHTHYYTPETHTTLKQHTHHAHIPHARTTHTTHIHIHTLVCRSTYIGTKHFYQKSSGVHTVHPACFVATSRVCDCIAFLSEEKYTSF